MPMRIGQGMDVHAFSTDPDRPLQLAGVEIPSAPGLAGHSDADVVLHAIVDALLGAAGLGDIGVIFGTNEDKWAGADSSLFITDTMSRVRAAELTITNLDCTVVAARPRLAPYRGQMRVHLAELLTVSVDRISLKATTTDGLGFTGRGEGIACLAVVLLEPIS